MIANLYGLFAAGNVTIGMLVVEKVIPGCPASELIEAGDILVRVNGRIVTHFLPLEDILDANVGNKVQLELQRGGRQVCVFLFEGILHHRPPCQWILFI